MYFRLQRTGLDVDRPARNTNYTMLKHGSRWKNPERVNLLHNSHLRAKTDGLNSVVYELHGIVKYPTFTHLLINVGEPPTTTTETTTKTTITTRTANNSMVMTTLTKKITEIYKIKK